VIQESVSLKNEPVSVEIESCEPYPPHQVVAGSERGVAVVWDVTSGKVRIYTTERQNIDAETCPEFQGKAWGPSCFQI
jgi:hypothetical protein